MPSFTYRAKDESGKEVTGKAQAENQEALADRLSRSGFYVLEMYADKQEVMHQDIFEAMQGISAREYITLLTHLSAALDAGLPILKVLDIISGQMKSKKLGQALKDVSADLMQGMAFSEALKKHPKIFPSYFSTMISVGEATGQLPESLNKLTVYMEKEEEFKQKIISIMIYPAILITVTTAVIIFLMTFIMPKFVSMFSQAKVELPLPTVILVAVSNAIRYQWYYILGAIIAVIIFVRLSITTKQGKYQFDNFKLHIPVFGNLFKQIYIVRFMNNFATLYSSGVSIGNALTLVEANIGNEVFAKVINGLKESVKEGSGIAEYLRASKLFPADALMMIASGEESGKLPLMLSKSAQLYEKDTDFLLKNVSAIMEPMIILVMGGVVGFVAMGILLPVFRMSTTVH